MKVAEIFYSLQGEGPSAGLPTVFLRLQGCNLRCLWCDTAYARSREGKSLGVSQVLDSVCNMLATRNCDRLCITGGEPLLQQAELVQVLDGLNSVLTVELFTNGTIWPNSSLVSRVSSLIVDFKCPSAGLDYPLTLDRVKFWVNELITVIHPKFTVSDDADLEFVEDMLRVIPRELYYRVLVSPVTKPKESIHDNGPWLRRVWHFCMKHGLRYSLQIHKAAFGLQKGV